MKLISVGDCVCDCYLDDGIYYPGGQAVNIAVDARRSGAEASEFIGIFGNDDAAHHIESSLMEEGVSTGRCRRAIGATAMPGVRIIDGDRVFFRGKRDTVAHLMRMRISQEDLDRIAGFDVCHATNEAGIDDELARIHGVTSLSYDFSTEHEHSMLERLCSTVDIAFFSGASLREEECEELARTAEGFGCTVVIVTRGAEGSICLAKDGMHHQGIVSCDAIDAMGAGDSFAAAFLVRYFDTHDVDRALAFAAERAALTCTYHGAFGHPHPCN